MPLLKAIQQLFPKLAIYPRPPPLPRYPRGTALHTREIPDPPFDSFDPTSLPGPLKIACHEEQFSATIPTFLNELHPPLMRKRTFLMRTAFFAVFHFLLSGPFPLLSRTKGEGAFFWGGEEQRRKEFRSMILISVKPPWQLSFIDFVAIRRPRDRLNVRVLSVLGRWRWSAGGINESIEVNVRKVYLELKRKCAESLICWILVKLILKSF